MSTEAQGRSDPRIEDGIGAVSYWRRFLNWVQAFEEAMDTSYDDIQDRRILALEREVQNLKSQAIADCRPE